VGVKEGKAYSDPTNWGTAQELQASKGRWSFLGVDEKENE